MIPVRQILRATARAALPLLIVLTAPLPVARAEAPRTAEWPQFLGPNRNGTYTGEDLAATWPNAGPKVLWQTDVGEGFAGPVVASGKLILFHRVGGEEIVACFDADTGKPVWRSAYPTTYRGQIVPDEGPRATPTVAGGRVYTFGAEGSLRCWNLTDGKELWAVNTQADFRAGQGYFGMACSPLVEGDAVILNVGGADGAGVVAFDAATGKVLWKATDHEASYASPVAATFGGRRYVLVFTRAGLVALDPKTGAVGFDFPWRARIDASVNAATPLVAGDLIFLSASYDTGAVLLAFDTPAPRKVWSSDESLSNHYATSVYHDGFLYGFHGRQEQGPSFRCVELKTGKVRWSQDDFGAGVVLLLAGGRLLILTEKGQLIAAPATPDGFKPAGKAQILGFDCRAYPALAGGRLYARDPKKLVCVDLRAAAAATTRPE